MVFSGGSLSRDFKWSLPSDHPIRGERGGVAPWTAEGDFHGLSPKHPMVTRPGARNAAKGVPSLRSQGGRGRVLSDAATWVPTAFLEWVWQECTQTVSLLGILSRL